MAQLPKIASRLLYRHRRHNVNAKTAAANSTVALMAIACRQQQQRGGHGLRAASNVSAETHAAAADFAGSARG